MALKWHRFGGRVDQMWRAETESDLGLLVSRLVAGGFVAEMSLRLGENVKVVARSPEFATLAEAQRWLEARAGQAQRAGLLDAQ